MIYEMTIMFMRQLYVHHLVSIVLFNASVSDLKIVLKFKRY